MAIQKIDRARLKHNMSTCKRKQLPFVNRSNKLLRGEIQIRNFDRPWDLCDYSTWLDEYLDFPTSTKET